MALSLSEEEILAETVKLYPVLYDKQAPGYKEKDVVFNAWNKVADKLEFVENLGLARVNFLYFDLRFLRLRSNSNNKSFFSSCSHISNQWNLILWVIF